jgi:hypothetical protein
MRRGLLGCVFDGGANLTLCRTARKIAFPRGAVAQFGRAPRSQCGGQGFDPPLLHQKESTTYGGTAPAVFVFVANTLPSRAESESRLRTAFFMLAFVAYV